MRSYKKSQTIAFYKLNPLFRCSLFFLKRFQIQMTGSYSHLNWNEVKRIKCIFTLFSTLILSLQRIILTTVISKNEKEIFIQECYYSQYFSPEVIKYPTTL